MEEQELPSQTSMDFIHHLEYANSETNYEETDMLSQYNQHSMENNILQQESQTEASQDQQMHDETVNEEEEISGAILQEVVGIIQKQIKDVIFKKEEEKVTLEVLGERKDIVAEYIQDLQELSEQVKQETEEVNIKVELVKEESQHLENRDLYNSEIIKKLAECMKTVEEGHKKLKSRSQKFRPKLVDQKQKILESIKEWENKISCLKSEINKKEAAVSNSRNALNPLVKKNQLLKSKVAEKREQVKNLEKKCEEIKSKRKDLNALKDRKCDLEKILVERSEKVRELEELKHQQEEDVNECTEKQEVRIREIESRLEAAQKVLAEKKEISKQKVEEYMALVLVLSSKEKRALELDERTGELNKKLKVRRDEFRLSEEESQKKALVEQEKLKESESKLSKLNQEKIELSRVLEEANQQYTVTLKETAENLAKKLELSEKSKTDAVMLNNIKFLDDKIEKKEKAIDELKQKLEELSSDERLKDVEKKKAYVTSSSQYLKEKHANLVKQAEEVKLCTAKMEEEVDAIKKINEEKQSELDNLMKELEFLESSDETGNHNRPTSSILKSPAGKKRYPISPKKVQFQGLSSYESSSSEAVVAKSRESTGVKSLDEILKEMQQGTFQKSPKVVNKRQIDID